jgi:YfiH family protein
VSLTSECRDIDGRPLPLLVSPVIPPEFRHGFTTRAGGVSPPPYDTFNLGLAWGDAREGVMENRRRLRAWLGVERLYLVRQVHGPAVIRVEGTGVPAETLAAQEADGLYTDAPGAALGVFVADCVPVLLADPRTGACAAVHAGWRGVVAGVVTSAVRALGQAYGTKPEDVRAAMGPSIGACCFEVGPEVVAAFRQLREPDGGDGVVRERSGAKPHIDLRRALALELEALGVPAGQIDAGGECTKCDPQSRFYSYRRDNTRTGQLMGVIARR